MLLSHFGLILILVSSLLSFSYNQEAFINIYEGEKTNIAHDYYHWFLTAKDLKTNQSQSFDFAKLKERGKLALSNDLQLEISKKFINARLFVTPFAGIILKQMPTEKDYEKNIAALKLKLYKGQKLLQEFDLEGEVQKDYVFEKGNLVLSLQRKSYQMPFAIELEDINRELYPGTEIAKSYISKVKVTTDNLQRELSVSMNKPFRFQGYTLYQSGFGTDEDGNEFSVFAVVRSFAYRLPYFASLITALGLFLHFISKFLQYAKTRL